MTEGRPATWGRPRRGKNFKLLLGIVASTAAALVVAACGGSAASTGGGTAATANPNGSSGKISTSNNAATAGKGTVDLTWWNMWSGAPATITKKMVSQFNSAQSKIHVTVLNVPSADGDAKLLSAIAAGDPPDVFTEWNPTIGQYAQSGAILPMDQYLTGKYSGLEKWMYPAVLNGGLYKGKLYAVPMSMNSFALIYNKSLMKAAGITSPPKTLAELDADQAKAWKFSGSRLEQIGFYPVTAGVNLLGVYFDIKGLGYQNGKYDLSAQPGGKALFNWLSTYTKYPYSAVSAMNSAYGNVGGGSEDPFSMGKQAFTLNGVWEIAANIATSNPSLEKDVGVEPFPSATGGVSDTGSYINGNYNFIPKGSKHPEQAFDFIAWLAGFNNPAMASYYPQGGWMPPSPQLGQTAAFQSWEKRAPYVKTFLALMLGKKSQSVPLTPGESEWSTAQTTALQRFATGKSTAAAAMQYIDAQGNKALAKAK